MVFQVTAVPFSKATRKRTGKAFVNIIDTLEPEWAEYRGCFTVLAIEQRVEELMDVKVIDVRTMRPEEVHRG